MPASTILVYRRDGSPCVNKKIALGFSSGMSQAGFTDSRGMVTLKHASSGKAGVYVSGKKCGSLHAPGKTTVIYS